MKIILLYLKNMNKAYYIVIIAGLLLLINFGRKYIQKTTSKKLTEYLFRGDFDNFEKLINKWYTKYLVHPFNIDFLKLNEALMKNNKKEIEKCFETFENTTITDKQKQAIYQKAFFYYLQEEDNTKLKKYYKLIKNLEDKTLFNNVDDIYRIVVEKDDSLLDKYLNVFKQNKENSMAAYLLYKIYTNKANKKKAEEYKNIFDELVKKGSYIK